MRRCAAVMIVALLTAPAMGQSFNIDMDVPGAGWGGGTPASSYGGAANQPGVWTPITQMGQTYHLLTGIGLPTSVTLEAVGVAGTFAQNNGLATGDFAKLMEDGLAVPTQDVSLFFHFNGLSPGKYFFYVYGGLTQSGEGQTLVSTLPFIGDQIVGGSLFDENTYFEGISHLRYQINIGDAGATSFRVRTVQGGSNVQGVIVGMQVQKLPPRLYVRAGAPDGGNGRSWNTAYNTIQAALEQIEEWDGVVDEIWVAQGVYYPTTELTQSIAIDLMTGLANIYGGFAGTETSLDQRDPAAHPTILSGNIGGPLPNDNSDTVVRVWDAYGGYGDEPVVLDGFTIMGGSGGHFTGDMGRGAGLEIIGGEALLRNCLFMNNEAADGAAVFSAIGKLTFVNCTFMNNSAASGGGVFANTVIPPNPGPVTRFINCRFHNNDADFRGGAINVVGGTTVLVNCVLTGNACYLDGGAIRATEGAALQLLNCSIVGNSSSALGGGAGGGLSVNSGATATLVNTILWDNHAASAYNGTMQSQLASSGGTITANYTTVQHYFSLLLPGTANNGANPMFLNADGGDGYGGLNDNLRLGAGSPLIDSGSNFGIGQDWGDLDGDGNVSELTPLDLDRNPRRVDDPASPNSGNGTGALVDRGAYEFQPVPVLLGDMDCNGAVNLADVPAMSLALTDPIQYGQVHGCILNGDFTGDGQVNGLDLQGFVSLLVQ